MDLLNVIVRWLHIAAGIMWIGHLYFFNFVNSQIAQVMDSGVKKAVVPELMPRSLYWFRWGAAYTWITGLLLLMLVYYHGGLMFEDGSWGAGSIVMVLLTFLVFGVYEMLAKSPLSKNTLLFGVIGLALTAAMTYLMIVWGEFSYRAYNIHIGAMFGTIMAANVWMRIWPAQKKIIAAVKEGNAPDPALAGLAALRSRHNTYLSVPLIYTMINAHTVVPGANSVLYLFAAIVIGWGAVAWTYRKAGTLKGF